VVAAGAGAGVAGVGADGEPGVGVGASGALSGETCVALQSSAGRFSSGVVGPPFS
jgi:hypothetical protein